MPEFPADPWQGLYVKTGDQLLTTTEAAARLGIRPGTLAVWRSRRIGPSYLRRAGAFRPRIFYRASDIEAYLRKQTVPEGRAPKPPLFPARRWWEDVGFT